MSEKKENFTMEIMEAMEKRLIFGPQSPSTLSTLSMVITS